MDALNAPRRVPAIVRAAARLVRDACLPRAALERAARLAVYVRCQPLAKGRRVLDLPCGRGWGAAHLLAAGALEVTGLDRPPLARRAERRFGQPGLAFLPFDPWAPPEGIGQLDLGVWTRPTAPVEPVLHWVLERLAPGAQLVVAAPPAAAREWRGRLRERFLQVDSVRLLGTGAAGLRFADAAGEAPTDTLFEVLTASAPRRHLPAGPLRLHVGAGSQRLEGWINVDIRPFPGVDLVADVTRGLDFEGVDGVFAEHFLEHLAADDALDFLTAVQRMLRPEGRLRLSTPNLDWVWHTHYRLTVGAEDKVRGALALNRAFHGWEHKLLWNRETLELALRLTGFRRLRWHRYGESDDPAFRGLERHETWDDDEALPHVLIVEARPGTPDPEGLAALRQRFQRELLDHVAGY